MGINLDKRIYKTTFNKMKLTGAVVIAAVAADKKVPPRHPLQRLAKLTEFSAEILNDWYGFLPSKDSWIEKFATNAERMERNFNRGNQRCGFYDEDQLPHGGPERKRRSDDDMDRYNREDPAKAQSKSRPVTASGPSDTCLNALVNVSTNIRSTA